MVKAGLDLQDDGTKPYHIVMSVFMHTAFKLSDDEYSVSGHYGREDESFAVTFDFGPETYQKFLDQLDEDLRARVRTALSRQPYRFLFQAPDIAIMTAVADLGETTITNENESYRPFIADDFIREEPGMWDAVDSAST
jgi:hypothetical protein